MPTGKVRIFELAKELDMPSKDLIALFGRLGIDAKNQLSIVDEKIADLLRAQLAKSARARAVAASQPAATAPATRAVAAATATATAVATPPATAQAVATSDAPPAKPVAAPAESVTSAAVTETPAAATPVRAAAAHPSPVRPKPRIAAAPEAPIPTLRPVSGQPRRPAAARPAAVASENGAEAVAIAPAETATTTVAAPSNGAIVEPAAPADVVHAAAETSTPVPTVAEVPEAPPVAAPPSVAVVDPAAGSADADADAAVAARPSASPRPAGDGPMPRPGAPLTGPRPAPGAGAPARPGPAGQPARPGNGQPPRSGVLPQRPIVRPVPSQSAMGDQPVMSLKPVPRGQSSIVAPRPVTPPVNPANSASPGPEVGIPGRPGVAPRPGQGVPGQAYRPGQPGAPANGRPPQPGVVPQAAAGAPPAGRRVSNGPFRPLAAPVNRPFTPRPPGSAPASPPQSPTPSSGAPGSAPPRGRSGRDRDEAKKDREKELLLEKQRQRKRGSFDVAPVAASAQLENIEIPDVLTVQELATSMIIPAKDVIKELIKMGTMATINQNISSDQAIAIARKFGFNAIVKEAGEEVVVEQEQDRPEMMVTRPPVVTVLGHVDHGKTSLLDKIRSANVASGEAGGITQRIGAYTVVKNDRKITFIDTPGHEAFTAMRARGAKVTDVAILVVAADDGVMPQTVEAISHILAADVPLVVAINKMDREDAQPDRVKTQLSERGIQAVDWGGKTEMVPVSARTGLGIEDLLETVLLEADIRDLKANPHRRATGVVIESALDRGRGAVATVLVQSGTLRVGDIIVVGASYGKIRALVDDKGKQVKKAGPSIPVEIMGLNDVPSAGDTLMVVSDEKAAREAAAKRQTKRRDVRIASSGPRISLESFMSMGSSGEKKTLNLILKADGNGAVEALRGRVEGISNAEVDIRVILAGVGAITPNDVNLASASNAVLIGFNIRPDETVKRLAENEQVDLRFYQVIYDVENDLRNAMRGMLAPKFREVVLGRAEVREIFKVSKVGTIAGCYVQSGKLTRNAKVRVLRDNAVAFESELESLRRFKDDVKEVAENFECGVQVARFSDLKEGDVLEAFTSELVAPELVPA